ncbi:MAG: hypothetical protein V4702_02800 [Patescibacteria group bacterium]
MSPVILLVLIASLPLLLAVFLRIKPLYLFVSIVTGYFWAEFLGESAEFTLRTFIRIDNPGVVIRLIFLLVPVLLTFVLMRKTLSKASLPFQFALLLADSLLLTTFLLPLLTMGTQSALYSTPAGSTFRQAHDVAIPVVAGMHLIVMFIMRPRDKHAKHHK